MGIMDSNTIKQRAAAREQAKTVASLVVEEAGRIDAAAQGAFWDELRKILPIEIQEVAVQTSAAAETPPMSDRQARAFGQSRMAFGEFQGTRIDEVPLERLQWYADTSPFQKQLRRYLASSRIQSEERADV
jgi:uncharacterized protein (DUF3820 family)